MYRIKNGDKKNSSETIVVNHVRHDVTQVSAEEMEVNYMSIFRICFGSSTDRN